MKKENKMTWSPRNRCEDDDLDDRDDGDQRLKESESKRSDKEDERRRDEHHHSRPGGGTFEPLAIFIHYANDHVFLAVFELKF